MICPYCDGHEAMTPAEFQVHRIYFLAETLEEFGRLTVTEEPVWGDVIVSAVGLGTPESSITMIIEHLTALSDDQVINEIRNWLRSPGEPPGPVHSS